MAWPEVKPLLSSEAMARPDSSASRAAPGLPSATWAIASWRTASHRKVRLPAQRSGGGQCGDPGGRIQRAGSGDPDGPVAPRRPPEDTGCRQGLRHQGLFRRPANQWHHAPWGGEHPGPPPLLQRWPHRASSGRRPIHARQEADRARVWLDQTGRRAAAAQGQGAITGGSGVPAAWGALQPDPPGESAQPTGGAGKKREGLRHQQRSAPGPRHNGHEQSLDGLNRTADQGYPWPAQQQRWGGARIGGSFSSPLDLLSLMTRP